MNLYLSAIALSVLAVSPSSWALYAPVVTGEMHYSRGMDAYEKLNYPACADELYLSHTGNQVKDNQAVLYLAFCQAKLGNKKYAAYNLSRVDEASLSRRDEEVYGTVYQKVEREFDALIPYQGWVMPFGAAIGYSTNAAKKSATDFGLAAGVSHRSWGLDASGERLNMHLRQGLSDYTQSQFGAGFTYSFLPNVWARADIAHVATNSASLGNNLVLGATLGYIPSPGTALALDYQHSNYPDLALGALNTNQVTASVDQSFISTPTTLLHGKFGVQSIFASAPSTYDATTQFSLRSSYFRYVFDLELRASSWIVSGQFWTGKEAFGARNQGALIFNALEEHKYGLGSKLGYYFTPRLLGQLSYSLEDYLASGAELKANAGVAAVMVSF